MQAGELGWDMIFCIVILTRFCLWDLSCVSTDKVSLSESTGIKKKKNQDIFNLNLMVPSFLHYN